MALADILSALERDYGKPRPPSTSDPLEMILWENVAYLVPDARREAAFRALVEQIGLEPDAIRSAPYEALREIAELGGMLPDQRVLKLRTIAEIAAREFPGGLRAALKQPLPRAKAALRRFPGIGEPGAEKILLFSRTAPILALESNGLRVLVRLGYGQESRNYAATYRSVRAAVAGEIVSDCTWLIRAHQLLRRHGQERCKAKQPYCGECRVAASCAYWRNRPS
ncbi:MAG: hypothetical protein U1E76_20400 [Planctomycetota bacterium]